jgi:hypothetical protein
MAQTLSESNYRVQNVGYQESFIGHENGIVVGLHDVIGAPIEVGSRYFIAHCLILTLAIVDRRRQQFSYILNQADYLYV